jgi:hypothetical protein
MSPLFRANSVLYKYTLYTGGLSNLTPLEEHVLLTGLTICVNYDTKNTVIRKFFDSTFPSGGK